MIPEEVVAMCVLCGRLFDAVLADADLYFLVGFLAAALASAASVLL